MKTIVLEVRDRMTRISVMATRMVSDDPAERAHLRETGYGTDFPLVMVTRMEEPESEYSPVEWGGRTMPAAHHYIAENFDRLKSGDVVDVEFALGEVDKPKEREVR